MLKVYAQQILHRRRWGSSGKELVSVSSVLARQHADRTTGIFAFAFTTSNTLPLYAALKGGMLPGQPKPKRSRRFTLLSTLSIAIAALLILPLVFFGQRPLLVRAFPYVTYFVTLCAICNRPQHYSQVPPSPSSRPPSVAFRAVLAFLNVSTLALTIPSIIITTPSLPLPLPIRRSTNFPVSKALLYILAICMSLMSRDVLRVVSDVVFVLAFFSTYALPGQYMPLNLVLIHSQASFSSIYSHRHPHLPPSPLYCDPSWYTHHPCYLSHASHASHSLPAFALFCILGPHVPQYERISE